MENLPQSGRNRDFLADRAQNEEKCCCRNLRLEQGFPTVFYLGPGGTSVTPNFIPSDLGKTKKKNARTNRTTF